MGKGKISWMALFNLLIALLAVAIASFYVARIIEHGGDSFDWIVTVCLLVIASGNAVQYFYGKNKNRK